MSEFSQIDDELLSAYLDDELSAEERARVEERLSVDPSARQLLDELRSVSQAMRGMPDAKLGADLRESVLRRAEREMLVAGNTKTTRDSAGATSRLPFGRSKRAWFWAGAAIAAGLMVMFIEREAARDAGLPKQVALSRPRPQAPAEPMPPLVMRAREENSEQKDVVAAAPTQGEPVASTPVAPASEAMADLAMSDGSGAAEESRVPLDSFAQPSEALARGGAGGAVGRGGDSVASDVRFVEGAGGEELLVVHVSVTPEAMRNRAFDTTLLNNRIEVEAESEVLADQPPAAQAVAAQDIEVVMVEAAPAQVAATLAEIQQDLKNYVAIEVNEPVAQLQAKAQRAKVEQLPADLKQYNRGRVLNQQKLQLSRDNRNYYFTPQQPNFADRLPKLSESLAKKNAAAQQAMSRQTDDVQLSAATPSAERPAEPQSMALGREVLDASSAEAPPAQGTASGKLQYYRGESWDYATQNIARRASQKLAKKADMLQVLFVLQADETSDPAATAATSLPSSATEPASSPASGAPSVPAQEEGLKRDE